MGGGSKSSQSLFAVGRKQKLVNRAIVNTGKVINVDLTKEKVTSVVIRSEKKWDNPHAAAYYQGLDDTLFIRRKYFAGLKTNVLVHENLHGRSGKHRYGKQNIGRILEEGTVEYLTQTTLAHGFRTSSKKFAKGYKTYHNEVSDVSALMAIVGRTEFLKAWKNGFYDYDIQQKIFDRQIHKINESQRLYREFTKQNPQSTFIEKNNFALKKDKELKQAERKDIRALKTQQGYEQIAKLLTKKGFKVTAKAMRTYPKNKKAKEYFFTHKIRSDMRNLKVQTWLYL